MTTDRCGIQCDNCREWDTISHARAIHIEETTGQLLCRACLGGDP